ncbi:GlxA family transcriptional regulator [Alloyangia pacifica]|uniref:Transcriptional regulator GlxA family, contains an amidase domain and an AraC-type DNA-binding HTH domain n=1 Tax=Alloyangia pacifica TaxID=311180 RepID=A0A1I6WF11_9RHOB|nr:GlxA family transcriptional regulator [Alloyangia pacifica]SDI64017.1 Transcriptional regulator GlxA family, contains an amidase domain and an AraC-type DNA-binding HTH domain [Alloyangia pacifica]SFT24595.1 Transcriptional regulator GlxA family, contains an amidase domain and an AraC-type DNA-binding HTH domain [Alloyangia pacifica]
MPASSPTEPVTAPSALRHVQIVIYRGFKCMEAVGPVNVFTAANRYLAAASHPARYDVELIAPTPGPVQSESFLTLTAERALAEATPQDTVMIAGALEIEEALRGNPQIVDWCRRHAAQARRFASLCTGTFFLAEAGLLDGRRATTHWSVAARLQQAYPDVRVEADAIFLREDNLYTSAGVTAAIDLALAFVEQDFGRDLALSVARDMVIYLKRPGGQSQFSAVLTGQAQVRSGIADIRTWIHANLERKLQTGDLAQRAGMSERNFVRQFTRDVGQNPSDYVMNARCERATTLLLETGLPVKTIAHRVGFSSDDQMRKVFNRKFSLTPREYRERFSTAA